MPKPIKRIHFIEYNARINTLALSPLFPKYGTPLLAAIMKEKGYDVSVFLEGVSDMSFGMLSECDRWKRGSLLKAKQYATPNTNAMTDRRNDIKTGERPAVPNFMAV